MTDLWASRREAARADARRKVAPLALRMRPRTLDEFVGQRHILGEGGLLRRMIDADTMTSVILHGPPGTGKTTLAEVIANVTDRVFVRENAASVGVKRIREVIQDADRLLAENGRRTILFLDEIHRFSKSQQDVLLGDVERGVITLIGATTENPLFAVNSALVSRAALFRLEPLTEEDIKDVVRRALQDNERGFGELDIDITGEALEAWAIKSEGDARRALTALEVAVESQRSQNGVGERIRIDRAIAGESIQQKVAVYGADGHYDHASAMIKSIRGSDPDAAIYWIARMLDAGEDPRFVARRLAILASEDIGNADPRALTIADASWSLVERIGMPEARITLAQCATYLAAAPKSKASYAAIQAAEADVKSGRVAQVPLFLRDPNTSAMPADSSGQSVPMRTHRAGGSDRYTYSHGSEHEAGGAGVTGQHYLGVDVRYYEPTEHGEEKDIGARLAEIRRLREQLRNRGEEAGDGAEHRA